MSKTANGCGNWHIHNHAVSKTLSGAFDASPNAKEKSLIYLANFKQSFTQAKNFNASFHYDLPFIA
jgi:hypothetical protein